MNLLVLSRAFLGMTMAFHIAFALFGVGLPLIISLIELLGIIRKDHRFLVLARRWTYAMVVLFIVGAISGIIVSVVFAVLLGPFMALAGKVIMLPFMLEGFVFFIEAIFLGLYAYTWDRFPEQSWKHWLLSLPIVIASAGTAFLITTVNAWMNTPQGFGYTNGMVFNVQPWQAMASPAVVPETAHSIMAYYATTAFVLAAVTVFQLIAHGRRVQFGSSYRFKKKITALLLVIAFVFAVCVAVTGDNSARFISHYEPEKLAAAEGVIHTEKDAPLIFGGVFHKDGDNDFDDRLSGGIAVTGLLSFMVGGSKNIMITGLSSFAPDTWPPLTIHYFFDGMAGIGMLMLITPFLFFVFYRWHHKWIFGSFMEWLIVITGFFSIIAVELGWMLTEIGRQPYVVRGIMTTAQAYTLSHTAILYAFIFPIAYTCLAIVTICILIRHYKRSDNSRYE